VALRTVSWTLYLVGIAIILGSYLRLVSPGVGWIGWVVAMAGWLIGLTLRRKHPIVADLERLEALRAKGSITQEEFEQYKAQISSPPQA
jgi:hypothetical protein